MTTRAFAYDAFISHSARDNPFVRRLAGDLSANGLSVFLAESELSAGDVLTERIGNAIRSSGVVIAVLSRHSLGSKWVEFEIRTALEDESSLPRLFPILIDDTDVPSWLADRVYVDFRENYKTGLKLLLEAFAERGAAPEAPTSAVADPEGLARAMGKDLDESRSAGRPIATIIGIISLVIAAIAAIPSFLQVFGDRPAIHYAVSETFLSIPPTLDHERIRNVLKDNGVADSQLSLELANSGDAPASVVKISLHTQGEVLRAWTVPSPQPDPVWVQIKEIPTPDPKLARTFELSDFAASDHTMAIHVSYFRQAGFPDSDVIVIADGKEASRVANLNELAKASIWSALSLPLTLAGVGIVLSLLVGFGATINANPTFRKILFIAIEGSLPRTMSSILRVLRKL